MNYALIMTEGSDELVFINVLLDKEILKFKREELLYDQAYEARTIKNSLKVKIMNLNQGDTIDIYRILDKGSADLKIPSQIIPEKINRKIKVITSPEFEVLFLIHDGMYNEYIKSKSKLKCSEFYKSKTKGYSKQYEYVYNYFSKLSDKEIYSLLDQYEKLRSHTRNKGELGLRSLLK